MTAAYDTVISIKLDFKCKLLRFLLDECRGSNDYKTSSQRRFHSNGDSKQNSLGCQRNSVPPKAITTFLTSRRIICCPQYQIKKKCELNVYSNQHSPLCLVPIYLEVKLDKSLEFCHHRLALRKKLRLSHC